MLMFSRSILDGVKVDTCEFRPTMFTADLSRQPGTCTEWVTYPDLVTLLHWEMDLTKDSSIFFICHKLEQRGDEHFITKG